MQTTYFFKDLQYYWDKNIRIRFVFLNFSKHETYFQQVLQVVVTYCLKKYIIKLFDKNLNISKN